MYIESWENLGCNFFCTKKIPCRKHTDAYRGLKLASEYSVHAGPDSTSDVSTIPCEAIPVSIALLSFAAYF